MTTATSPASSTAKGSIISSDGTLPRLRSPRGGLTVGDRHYRGGVYLPESARPALEALARKAAKVATAEPFVVGIMGACYRVRSIPCSASVGTVAYQVIPMDKPTETYHVMHDNHGETSCSCPDWEFRRKGTGVDCKHGRGLAALGLIPSTTPATLPPFARRPATAGLLEDRPQLLITRFRRPRFEPSRDDVAEAARIFGW